MGPTIFLGILLMMAFIYLLAMSKDVVLAQKFCYILSNQLFVLIVSFVFMIIEICLIKPLVARFDVDKLKTFIDMIEIPENIKNI